MDQLTRIFLQEAADQIESLESLLLDLEESHASVELQEHFMRAAHSLKGASGTAGYSLLADLAHEVENLVQTLQEGRLTPGPDYFDLMYRSLEAMRRYLAPLAQGREDVTELESVQRELKEWFEGNGRQESELSAASAQTQDDFNLGEYDLLRIGVLEGQGKALYRIDIGFKGDTVDHEQQAISIFKELRRSGDILQSIPSEGLLADIAEENRLVLLFSCDLGLEEIGRLLPQDNLLSVAVSEYRRDRTLPVADNSAGENFIKTFASEKTVRLEMEVLDELLRLVGELMLNRVRLARISGEYQSRLADRELAAEIEETAEKLEHLTADLQSGIMRARMVPVARLFRMMKRRARQVSRRLETRVRLIGHGEWTEIDKKLFDLLSENLVAMTEVLAETICSQSSAGDSELSVFAARKGNNVILKFVGAGSPPGEDGLEQIRSSIVDCGGRLIVGEENENFQLSVSLPITLAIVPVMMVEAAEEIYAFPLEAITETFRLEKDKSSTVEGKEITEVRGNALSLLDMGDALDIAQRNEEFKQKFVVVVESGSEPIGIIVDRLIGKFDVVIKPLGSHFNGVRHISGSTILGDGKVALIINSETLIAEARGAAA